MLDLTLVDGLYRVRTYTLQKYLQFTPDRSRVSLGECNTQLDSQKWNIRKVPGEDNTYRITSLDHKCALSWSPKEALEGDRRYLKMEEGDNTNAKWLLELTSPKGPRLVAKGEEEPHFADSYEGASGVYLIESNWDGAHQHWAFELIQPAPQSTNSFEHKFFPLTVEQAAQQPEGCEYDIIIVGSGIGGGVLANDLYDTNQKLGPKDSKRILLLEKGGLVFHSHCLNTARPAGLENDRGQQNDTFFLQFKEDYQYTHDTEQPLHNSREWKSGPMFNLGGRSAAWGLFAPRIHDLVLKKHFPKVAKPLLDEYYDKAERLMLLSLPTTKRVHQHIMDRLTTAWREVENDEHNSEAQWHWGRIASEFHDDRNFDFAEGAYSSIDKILEIAMSKPKVKDDNSRSGRRTVEHEHFKTVLHADVRSLDLNETGAVSAVNVRTREGRTIPIPVKKDGKVVLCAGSVHSPAILMRSGKAGTGTPWKDELREHGGLHLTDHDIFAYTHSFRYTEPKHRDEIGAMKLQTYVDIGPGALPRTALANMSIDASSFLPRSTSPDINLPQFIMVFILQRPLVGANNITIDSNNEPVVKLTRGEDPDEKQMMKMKELTASAMNSLKESAGLRFVGYDTEGRKVQASDIQLGKLDLGGVAHELGTLPMDTGKNHANCLDENLSIVPELSKGVYVCDLSCFPYSPESNPTLTLAALAIRLSRHLHPRRSVDIGGILPDQIQAVNHSGVKVRVWLTNHQPNEEGQLQPAEAPVDLEPGQKKDWTRSPKTVQALFVYQPDLKAGSGKFQDEPVVINAYPGKLVSIQN